MRLAIVKKDNCNPNRCNKECFKFCPRNRMGENCVMEGEGKKPVIDETLCVGCGICVNKCPLKAIEIIKLPEELKQKPIIRYDKNGFALYNLPIPKKGKVVGILGRNGIGKTTAIKILAGLLKPNFGDIGKEYNYRDLEEFFRGSETQNYFRKLEKGEIKISFKPQKVDELIGFKGKVKDILKKFDEKGKLKEIVKELELSKVLSSRFKDLAGGELQRVAIAICSLKKANVYFFDEPSSYLDIKQRLKVAKFIRKLAEENSVLVVEHDLIALDYLSDVIHIFYGKSACYGICSLPKSTKEGINSYLSGFLRQENIRFRDKKLNFFGRAVSKKFKDELVSWPDFKKKLNSFSLKANQGNINRKEVVGVLGENAIGKTTFIKVLAGVLKAGVDLGLKISYKPQYLKAGKELVRDVLKEAIKEYKVELIDRLELEELFTRKVNELSGGELQRVAISSCLARDCDLILLDEPSAYLDVEQRLIVSKVINEIVERKEIGILVVDHDLLFLDHLSNRLLVFEGEPAVKGETIGPVGMEEGMNRLLKELSITMRRDEMSGRPRVNKKGSLKDRGQRKEGKYFY